MADYAGAREAIARVLSTDNCCQECTDGGAWEDRLYLADKVLDALGLEQAHSHDPLCPYCDGDGYVTNWSDAKAGSAPCADCGPLYRLTGAYAEEHS